MQSTISHAAEADFVKTSTGYAERGATIPDLLLMRQTCGSKVQGKAAGGIRTLDTLDEALAVIATGTTRIGTRSTVAIMEEARKRADGQEDLPFKAGGNLVSGGY
jgi:deoxyribose-phosphate aldolase